MCLTILVSEKHELVSEKSGKSQGILFHQSAGNPELTCTARVESPSFQDNTPDASDTNTVHQTSSTDGDTLETNVEQSSSVTAVEKQVTFPDIVESPSFQDNTPDASDTNTVHQISSTDGDTLETNVEQSSPVTAVEDQLTCTARVESPSFQDNTPDASDTNTVHQTSSTEGDTLETNVEQSSPVTAVEDQLTCTARVESPSFQDNTPDASDTNTVHQTSSTDGDTLETNVEQSSPVTADEDQLTCTARVESPSFQDNTPDASDTNTVHQTSSTDGDTLETNVEQSSPVTAVEDQLTCTARVESPSFQDNTPDASDTNTVHQTSSTEGDTLETNVEQSSPVTAVEDQVTFPDIVESLFWEDNADPCTDDRVDSSSCDDGFETDDFPMLQQLKEDQVLGEDHTVVAKSAASVSVQRKRKASDSGDELSSVKKKYARLKEKYEKLLEANREPAVTYTSKDVPAVPEQVQVTCKELPVEPHSSSEESAYMEAKINEVQKKRIYDKLLACYYCGNVYKHRITEHLQLVHPNEMDVAKAVGTSDEKKRDNIFLRLKNLGNFKYNLSVLEKKGNDIIVARRPNKGPIVAKNYLPCVSCYGFYLGKDLWRHEKNCQLKVGQVGKSASVQAESRVLLRSSVSSDPGTGDGLKLLDRLNTRSDSIKCEIVNDTLVIKFGTVLLEKLGDRRKNDISQRIRQLTRLKMQINTTKNDKTEQLFDLISGNGFDTVVEGVRNLCGTYENEEKVVRMKKPGLALRLGHNLIKAAEIKCGMALRMDDEASCNQAETFCKLYRREWNDKISSVALSTLKTNKFNKGQVIPLTDDLVKLKNHLSSRMSALAEKLQSSPAYKVWRELAEVTMVKILLLNKRRGAEASKLLISAYQSRPNWEETTNKEILGSLSPLEKKMFSRMDMVHTQGKQDKKVATLLNRDMVDAINLLIATRAACGILDTNKYVFANQLDGHLSTWTSLRDQAVQAQCSKPELINCNSLRKNIATVCQLMDLNDGEVQWVSSHLGHTVKTHKDFYRLQEAAIEIGKVSKLLIAAESGKLSKYKGKSLAALQFDDDDESDNDEDDDDEEATKDDSIDDALAGDINAIDSSNDEPPEKPPYQRPQRKRRVKAARKEICSRARESSVEELPVARLCQKRQRIHHVMPAQKESSSRDSHADMDSDDSLHDPTYTLEKGSEESSGEELKMRKRRWSEEENIIFKQCFKNCLDDKIMPTSVQLKVAAKRLPERGIAQIRTRVHNVIKGKQVM
ncbi:uncharacterized protein LOC128202688 isoform X2 [Mya arenaria]|uniref:uncharacterized protein LOC128202688 isoform X2 n=2 Tax=Mya arenaria TaxID=6604 RepID=UPI0022E0723C|nr:uncharacterized protein LOC128202688 isoform X2 [Mya arenaria]